MVFIVPYFFENIVEEIVEKLMGVSVHGAVEESEGIAELVNELEGAWIDDALIGGKFERYRERERRGGVEPEN